MTNKDIDKKLRVYKGNGLISEGVYWQVIDEIQSLISQVREEEKEKWAEVVALAYKIIDERRNKV